MLKKKGIYVTMLILTGAFLSCIPFWIERITESSDNTEHERKHNVEGVDYSHPFNLKFLYAYQDERKKVNAHPDVPSGTNMIIMYSIDSIIGSRTTQNNINIFFTLNVRNKSLLEKDLKKLDNIIFFLNDSLQLSKQYDNVYFTIFKETKYINDFYQFKKDQKVMFDHSYCYLLKSYHFVHNED